jgi:hypothetical protein
MNEESKFLEQISVAKRALSSARTLVDVMKVRTKAEAVRSLGVAARDSELVTLATEVKLRAERRLGEMLKEIKEEGDIRQGKAALTVDGHRQLRDLNISRDLSSIKLQVEKIEAVVREVMVKDVHYTTLPGCERPCLLKPGAEKLAMVFRLAASYERTRRDLPHDHREYEIICSLTHFPTGQIIGQGLGLASSMESRYRWRDEWENTQKPVPPLYWRMRSSNPEKALSLIAGRGFAVKKFDNEWFIAKHSSERRENPDIADTWNTVLKMARKRSLTDAILTCTAASDCFSREDPEDEDLEDESSPPARQRAGLLKLLMSDPVKRFLVCVNQKEFRFRVADPGVRAGAAA